MATGNERPLIPWTMVGGVGLPHVFQDGACCPQDVASHAWVLGMGGMPRSTRTLETSLTKIASHPASVSHPTLASLRDLQSSMNSISSSWWS
jgi:hypothetical protein